MNNLCYLVIFFLLLAAGRLSAQTAVGDYRSGFRKIGNTLSFSNEQADVQLEFCTPEVFRIRTSWKREFAANEPWMVIRYEWPEVPVSVEELDDHFLLQTEKLDIRIGKFPFSIEVFDTAGNLINSERWDRRTGGAEVWENQVACQKRMSADEHFFGFGERMDFLDRRGKKLRLNVGRGQGRPHIIGAYNTLEANYSPVPFFMSTKGYGIFFHTPYASEWDMGAAEPDAYSFQAEGQELDYYFIYGPDFPAILDRYTDLTGKSPLLPRFALGLHVGTYSGGTWGHEELTSTDYVVNLGRKFRQLGIPVDVLHLDSTWRIFGENGGKGATSFEWRETFKNPEAMFDSLYAMNFQMVGLHLRPRFDNGNNLRLLDQARQQGFVYPEENNPGEFVNFFAPEAVDWWWEQGVKRVASIGAMFLKTDEGSAFGAPANESDKTGPTDAAARRLHNLFPIAYAKAPYEKFAAYNGLRGMNHTREGYAGIQRYPFIFAGDWPSEWQYFAPVIKAGLNIGLSGVGYWAHCMGGFEHPADPELYIRWCQFGLLSPVAHLFGMDHPGYKEPWNYGNEALRIFKQYDQLRYQLNPYLYSQAYQLYRTGMPLMRALVLDYQDDPNVYEIGDQYLLGSHLLVCPVTEKGAQTRVVYLPEGAWTDYWTGKRYEGKQFIQVLTPLDQIPLFVRGGAIVPMQESVNYIGEKPLDQVNLHIYPRDTSTFSLYDDDGKSTGYQEGLFALTKIRCRENDEMIAVDIARPEGNYALVERTYLLAVHTEKAPATVSVNGAKASLLQGNATLKKHEWSYDKEAGLLKVNAGQHSDRAIEVAIRFGKKQ